MKRNSPRQGSTRQNNGQCGPRRERAEEVQGPKWPSSFVLHIGRSAGLRWTVTFVSKVYSEIVLSNLAKAATRMGVRPCGSIVHA